MRIMVVDDEQEIRDYISGMPEWERMGCRVVGSAANGWKALELMPELQPELLITDIRMPEMDGIQLAERVRETLPELPIIFLTAYNEFEYAQKGIKLGVSDFLTKPFRAGDLVQSVEVLLSHRKDVRSWLEREEAFDLLASHVLSAQEKRQWLRGQELPEERCLLLYVEIDYLVSTAPERTPFSKLYLKRELGAAVERSGLRAWAASAASGMYALLLSPSGAEPGELNRRALELARSLIAGSGGQEAFTLSAALSRELSSPLELETAIAQVAQGMEYRMLLGRRSVIAYDALESMLDERKKETDFSVIRLGDLIRRADTEGIRTLLRDIYRQMLATGSGKKQMQHVCLSLLDKAEQVLLESESALPGVSKVEIRERMLSCVILTDLMSLTERQLLEYAARMSEAMGQTSKSLVLEAKRVIETCYMEDINLQTTAKRLSVNYSYLSRLIKKETGKNFSDLLWEHRIEEAKTRLVRGDLKAYEVAYAVGFKDSSHFNILFKKMTGLTPNAYRALAEASPSV